MKHLLKSLSLIIAIGFVAGNAIHFMANPVIPIILLIAALFFLKSPKHDMITAAGIQREIWENHIVANLFKNNEFLLKSVDASEYVVRGKIVHIPQSGGLPNIVKNRTSIPATVTSRTDTTNDYNLDAYTSDPILITNAEEVELSYNKRESILYEHEAALRQNIAENMLYTWAPTANIINSTGIPNSNPAATPTKSAAYLPSATGNRLNFTTWDLRQAQMKLDSSNVPEEDRYALFSAQAYQQLITDMTATQYRDFSSVMDPRTGVVGELFGFKIMKRSTSMAYDLTGSAAPKVVGAAGLATDCDSVLCWQSQAVERAIGDVLFFEQMNNPVYYGDLFSMLVRMGGRKRRAAEENIVAIVQGAAS